MPTPDPPPEIALPVTYYQDFKDGDRIFDAQGNPVHIREVAGYINAVPALTARVTELERALRNVLPYARSFRTHQAEAGFSTKPTSDAIDYAESALLGQGGAK